MSTSLKGTASARLREQLSYQPRELRFGTSGRRGLVADLTQLEVYLNVLGELQYLQSLQTSEGGIVRGEEIYVGYDLRPSSTAFVDEQQGRGEIAQAVFAAIRDAGMVPVNLGRIPTPALTSYALSKGRGSLMVTGSHIPFDRNGYKLNTSAGELLKEHETPIAAAVAYVRGQLYDQSTESSLFDRSGRLKTGHQELPAEDPQAIAAYMNRYTEFFKGKTLEGLRILVYQHSAVGRDILTDMLQRLGANVIPAGRSDEFVPIDTENIDAAQLSLLQRLCDEASRSHGRPDAVVSVDGDSDRPLLLGVVPSTGEVQFFGGDLVGMVVAEYLKADAVVVPISCNDAIDRGNLAAVLEPKTRIGSPYVISGMQAALARGKRAVCGWEANGGFLLASDITRDGRLLRALPTRDAALPILCTLFSASEAGLTIPDLFGRLPKRFSRAALLKDFPRAVSTKIIRYLSPSDPSLQEIRFPDDVAGADPTLHSSEADELRRRLKLFLAEAHGFGQITNLNYVDGVRVTFANNDVVHIRPSGNADELRVYAVSDTKERSHAIAALAIAEPNGILRNLEHSLEKREA